MDAVLATVGVLARPLAVGRLYRVSRLVTGREVWELGQREGVTYTALVQGKEVLGAAGLDLVAVAPAENGDREAIANHQSVRSQLAHWTIALTRS